MKDNKSTNTGKAQPNKITRKEALKKGGKYAALTAAAMLIVLSPKESQAVSPNNPTRLPPWTGL